jgi:hypothetical protein
MPRGILLPLATAIVLAAAVAAPAVHAGPLREIVPRASTFFADGVRYAAWQTGDRPITVLDTRTGRRTTVTPPPGCVLGPSSSGYDQPPSAPRSAGSLRPGVRVWCNGSADDVHRLDLLSGGVAPFDATPIRPCGAVRRTRSAQRVSYDYDRTALLRVDRLPITLSRCGRPTTVLDRRGPGAPDHPHVSVGWATWDTGLDPDFHIRDTVGPPLPGRIHAVAVNSLRRLDWTIPSRTLDVCGTRLRGPWGYSEHTHDRVFWVASLGITNDCWDPGDVRVYSARLPR